LVPGCRCTPCPSSNLPGIVKPEGFVVYIFMTMRYSLDQGLSAADPFALPVRNSLRPCSVSPPRSSNRTCAILASGSRTGFTSDLGMPVGKDVPKTNEAIHAGFGPFRIRISVESGQPFRTKADKHFGAIRTRISDQSGQPLGG
jgi:hypothetical protein